MALGALSFYHNYGPATAAVDNVPATIETELSIKGYARLNEEVQITIPTAYLKPTRLRNRPVEATGEGELVQALPKGRANPSLSVSIGAVPSAFDIAQAVWLQNMTAVNVPGTTGAQLNSAGAGGNPWDATLASNNTPGTFGALLQDIPEDILTMTDGVETGFTVRDALRLMLSAMAGKISGAASNTIRIRDVADAKDRITATVDTSGNRTAITYDVS